MTIAYIHNYLRLCKSFNFKRASQSFRRDVRKTLTKMAGNVFENVDKIIVNTGNILSLNDITKKSGQNTTEELVEAINITIREFKNGVALPPEPNRTLNVKRSNDDLQSKILENDLNDLKIGLKIFLNSDNKTLLTEAVDGAFRTLNVDSINDIIIAYKQNGEDSKNLNEILAIWKNLEAYNKNGKIKQLGIADIEEAQFRALYESTEIKPSIIQINLATCCVVPPTLQAFCKENEVKLLTHSDATDILPLTAIETVFSKQLSLQWALRFLIHIKARGVLTTKGYLLSLQGGQ